MLSYETSLPHEVWIATAVLAMIMVGFIDSVRRHSRIRRRQTFAAEYRDKFIDYANSRGEHRDAYRFLTLNANRMQREMGDFGVYASFRPPFEGVQYRNYSVILNMIPRIRQFMDDNHTGLWNGQISNYVHAVDECLLRYIGTNSDQISDSSRQLRNPISWFRRGFEQIVSVPLHVLAVFGLMGTRTIEFVRNSLLFKIATGLAGLISFASAVLSLVIGWSDAQVLFAELWQFARGP